MKNKNIIKVFEAAGYCHIMPLSFIKNNGVTITKIDLNENKKYRLKEICRIISELHFLSRIEIKLIIVNDSMK